MFSEEYDTDCTNENLPYTPKIRPSSNVKNRKSPKHRDYEGAKRERLEKGKAKNVSRNDSQRNLAEDDRSLENAANSEKPNDEEDILPEAIKEVPITEREMFNNSVDDDSQKTYLTLGGNREEVTDDNDDEEEKVRYISI